MTEPLWTNPGLKSGIWRAPADLHLKKTGRKKEKRLTGNDSSNLSLKILACGEKPAAPTSSYGG